MTVEKKRLMRSLPLQLGLRGPCFGKRPTNAVARRERFAHLGVLCGPSLRLTSCIRDLEARLKPQSATDRRAIPSFARKLRRTLSGAFAQSAQTEPLDYMFPGATIARRTLRSIRHRAYPPP